MITKKEKDFINSQILENQKNIEEIEKRIQSLEKERDYFQNEIKEKEITIKNFKANIIFGSEQSEEIETKLINYKNQIFKLKKQKINKVKKFFIKFSDFSPHVLVWRKQGNGMSSTILFKQNKIVGNI